MSFVTTEQAPVTQSAPIVTPGRTKVRAPRKARGPTVILSVIRNIVFAKSCVPVQR
ncbi:MAG: hypothetical protein WDO13_16850 [Verrucomicrobiota bacterium]